MGLKLRIVLLLVMAGLTACRRVPEAIEYGIDHCTHCKMQIEDQKFGAEIITAKGRILKFDAIECMVLYYKQDPAGNLEVHSMWTIDFAKPGTWVKADSAYFLHSKNLPSPMGMFLTSFEKREEIEDLRRQYDGRMIGWPEVLTLIEREKLSRGM